VLTKEVWERTGHPKKLAILKQLQTHFKAVGYLMKSWKRGTPFLRVPAPLHRCLAECNKCKSALDLLCNSLCRSLKKNL